MLEFKDAFEYPFNRPNGLLNGFWILFPIFGWFALSGYNIRIAKGFLKGNYTKTPEMKFGDDMKYGFIMFIKGIPFFFAFLFVSFLISLVPILGDIGNILLGLFVVPLLTLNFFKKETIDSYFEFEVLNKAFKHFNDLALAALKSIALGIIFALLIIVYVGFPAGMFTKHIFYAEFFSKYIK